MDPDPDPRGPKTYGSDEFGSATLVGTQKSDVLAVCLMILVKMFIIREENDLVFIGWLSYGAQSF
jgi:hypothetical protein